MNNQQNSISSFLPTFLLLASFSSIHSLQAQSGSPPVSIESLVENAIAANPEIQFYGAEIAAAKADRKVAGRLGNPELNFEIGRRSVRDQGFQQEGVAYAVSLVQPIEWPGRLGLRKAIANGDKELAELGLERFRYHLASKVRQLGFRLTTAQEKAVIAGVVSGRFEAVKKVLLQREVGGITPRLEIKAIDAASVSIEKEALEAAIAMQKILLELNQLLGRRATAPLVVKRTEYQFPEPRSIETLMTLTLTNHYDMHVRRAELAQQGIKVSLAENERFPTIRVGPYVSREEAGEVESQAGIGFSLELPIFKNGKAEVTQAQAREAQAEALINATARDLEKKVATSSLVYRNSYQQLQSWSSEKIDSLSEAAELADRHYRLGAVPVSTYIELQQNYLEALEAINEVKADALEAALEIEELTGSVGVPTTSASIPSKQSRPLVARPIEN
ncbi:TolC family protein [Verrucomicrobiales bacterium BCK34]|nr:TolC family protein [Verrucomicrobiales bacterium BCK34]